MVHGNKDIWSKFAQDSPKTALLVGPSGVGKSTGTIDLASALVGEGNVIFSENPKTEEVREMCRWASYGLSSRQVIILDIKEVNDALWTPLKYLLENASKDVYVWVIVTHRIFQKHNLGNLGFVYNFSLLKPEEMRGLFEEQGVEVEEDSALTMMGDVDRVLTVNSSNNLIPAVSNWVKAVANKDVELLHVVAQRWSVQHTAMLLEELSYQAMGKSKFEVDTNLKMNPTNVRDAMTLFAAKKSSLSPHLSAMAIGYMLVGE